MRKNNAILKKSFLKKELEIFDLLCKEHLTQEEEKKVKLAAKELYNTLLSKKKDLFVVGWQNDPQPKRACQERDCYGA